MAFTAGEITNIANAALDYYLDKGDVYRQSMQKRPLFDKMVARKKYFPGGKGSISVAVSGAFGAGPDALACKESERGRGRNRKHTVGCPDKPVAPRNRPTRYARDPQLAHTPDRADDVKDRVHRADFVQVHLLRSHAMRLALDLGDG